MKWIQCFLLLFLCSALCSALFSCGHFRSDTAFPLKKGEVSIHFTAQYQKTESVINRVYVYPPLKISKDGTASEKLFHTFDSKGNLVWHAPDPLSVELQRMVELELEKRSFRVVPFSQVLDPQNGHEILVFNAFYSGGYKKKEQLADDEAKFLLFRLLASTFPEDLDVKKKKDVVFVEALTRYHESDSWFSALKSSLKKGVEHVGENGKGIETCLIAF